MEVRTSKQRHQDRDSTNADVDTMQNAPAAGEPIKSLRGETVELTARGELHTLEFPIDIRTDWDSYQKSLGRCNLVTDHVLDGVPQGVHVVKPPGAQEE